MTELPAGWERRRLGEIASIRSGRTPKGLERYLAERPDSHRSIPFFKVGDMNSDSALLREARVTLSPDEVVDLRVELLPRGAVVFPKAGGAIATNKKRVLARDGAIDLNCMAVIAGALIDPRYLRLWFEHLDLAGLSDGSVLPQISKKRVEGLSVPVPPLEEQQRIVAILDDHLSRLDAATGAARNSVLRLSALRLSALTTTRDELVEEGVLMRPLGAVAQTALGKMLDAKRAAGTPTPYLRNINVRWGSFELDDLQEVPLSKDEQERLALQESDLLVCEGGEPGRCAVWPGSESLVAYQKALHRVRTHDPESVDVHFLAVMLEEFIKAGRADQMFTGTTIKHLPQEKLRLVELPIPTLERQRDVLRSLDSLDEGAALLENELGKVQSRAASLRRALLTAAFTGTLTS
ncbi:MAG: hypothetical protein EOL91_09170 [Actinobacteria bacterium]|nr:hypothetical protein [Actinomycetota bacterium]